MGPIDISILTVFGLGAVRGLIRGLIKEVAALAAILLGGWLAWRYHGALAKPMKGMLPGVAAEVLAFVALLLLVGLAAHLLGNLLTKVVKLALLGWVNRIGGIAIGLLEAALLTGMVCYAIVSVPLSFPLKDSIRKHAVASKLTQLGGIALDRANSLRTQAP